MYRKHFDLVKGEESLRTFSAPLPQLASSVRNAFRCRRQQDLPTNAKGTLDYKVKYSVLVAARLLCNHPPPPPPAHPSQIVRSCHKQAREYAHVTETRLTGGP